MFRFLFCVNPCLLSGISSLDPRYLLPYFYSLRSLCACGLMFRLYCHSPSLGTLFLCVPSRRVFGLGVGRRHRPLGRPQQAAAAHLLSAAMFPLRPKPPLTLGTRAAATRVPTPCTDLKFKKATSTKPRNATLYKWSICRRASGGRGRSVAKGAPATCCRRFFRGGGAFSGVVVQRAGVCGCGRPWRLGERIWAGAHRGRQKEKRELPCLWQGICLPGAG